MDTASFQPWLQWLCAPLAEGIYSFQNVIRYRDLLWQLVSTDLHGRYVGSFLGVFWNVLHPLILILIYTLVFSKVMGARLGGEASPFSFSIYLCAGLLPWGVFAETINRCTSVFWDHANLVKKIAFPTILLHAYIVVAGAINLSIQVVLFLMFVWWFHELPPLAAVLMWAGLMVLQLGFAVGIGLLTSVIDVFFRDLSEVVKVFLQMWFWLTPIVYSPSILPSWVMELMQYNIVARFSHAHQSLVLHGTFPSLQEYVVLGASTLGVVLLGSVCFRSLRRQIPDEL